MVALVGEGPGRIDHKLGTGEYRKLLRQQACRFSSTLLDRSSLFHADRRAGPIGLAPDSVDGFAIAAAKLATLALRSGTNPAPWRAQRRLRLPAESWSMQSTGNTTLGLTRRASDNLPCVRRLAASEFVGQFLSGRDEIE
jgi:hypothetical protein